MDRFGCWLMPSISTTQVQDLQVWLARCGPNDLSRMIVVIEEAESVCAVRCDALHRRFRQQLRREGPRLGARGARSVGQELGLMIIQGAVGDLERRRRWLHEVRLYLQERQQP